MDKSQESLNVISKEIRSCKYVLTQQVSKKKYVEFIWDHKFIDQKLLSGKEHLVNKVVDIPPLESPVFCKV